MKNLKLETIRNYKSNKCSIKIPVVLYVDSNDKCDINDLVYIMFLLSINYGSEKYVCKKYLDLDEVRQIIEYLRKSIDYVEILKKQNDSNLETIIKSSINIINFEQIDKDKIQTIGQLVIEEDNENKPYITIDLAKKSNKLGIRLITLDEIISCCWLTIEEVQKLIDGFALSISVLNQNPPSIISNLHLGKVEAISSIGKKYWINVERDGTSTYDENQPNIILDITEVEEDNGLSHTWWLDNSDITRLLEIFKKLRTNLYQSNSVIGFLGESQSSSWLTVGVEQNPSVFYNCNISSQNQNQNWINLIFDDELVKDNDGSRVLWLTIDNLEKLGRFLLDAIESQANQCSRLDSLSQLEDVVILELNF